MDYLFAPGGEGENADPFRRAMRAFLKSRGPKVAPADTSNVQQFLQYVNGDLLTGEVGVLYLSGHGNENASMGIALDEKSEGTKPRDFDADDVRDAIISGSLLIQPRLIGAATEVRIRGCRIGESPGFLDLLRRAFGGTVPVSAPRHYTAPVNMTPHFYESFLHGDHEVRSRTRLKPGEVLEAFRKFTLIDKKTRVPDTVWSEFLPPANWSGWGTDVKAERPIASVTRPLGARLGGRTELELRDAAKFVHAVVKPEMPEMPDLKVPPGQTGSDEAIRAALKKAPWPERYQKTVKNPFPVHERYGFASLTEFIDAHVWTRTKAGKASGSRHVYTARHPVLDMTGNLLVNFQDGTGTEDAVVNLKETDGRFFGWSTP